MKGIKVPLRQKLLVELDKPRVLWALEKFWDQFFMFVRTSGRHSDGLSAEEAVQGWYFRSSSIVLPYFSLYIPVVITFNHLISLSLSLSLYFTFSALILSLFFFTCLPYSLSSLLFPFCYLHSHSFTMLIFFSDKPSFTYSANTFYVSCLKLAHRFDDSSQFRKCSSYRYKEKCIFSP